MRGDTGEVNRRYFLFLLFPLLPLLFLLGESDQAFLTRDVSLAYLPAKRFWVDSILALGQVPGWNPLSYGGIPFRADLNLSPLHPLNFLFLLIPHAVDKGYLIFLGVHLLLLMWGTFLLFRKLKMGKEGALIATLAFALSGLSYSMMSLLNVASSLAALPFFFYFLLNLQKSFSWLALMGTALAWAWPVYCGDPQFSYWMALGMIFFVGRRSVRERSPAPLFHGLFASLLVVGLSAAQLLPSLNLVLSSERGFGRLSLSATERFSLHPLRVLDIFLPLPFGNPGSGAGHWLGGLTDAFFTMPFVLHLYIGVVTGAFVLFRFSRFFRRRVRSARTLLLASLITILFVAALGFHSPLDLYAVFIRFLPGWSLFRYPERLVVPGVFCLFLWAGPLFRFLAWKLRAAPPKGKIFLRAAVALTVWAAILFFLRLGLPSLEFRTLSASFIHVSLLSALFLLFWHFRARFGWLKKYSLPIFCLLIILDQLPFGFLLLWRTSSQEVSFRSNEFAEKVQKNLASRKEEINKGAANRYFHGTYQGAFPTSSENPLIKGQAWDWGVMYPNISMYFGLASPAGYSTFDPKEILTLWGKRGRTDPGRLLNLLSVAYFPIAGSDGLPSLQFNPEALPLAWLPASVAFLPEQNAREALLFREDFPYRKKGVLRGTAGEWKQPGREWEIKSFLRTPDHLTVELAVNSAESYFIWNERWNGNWRAYWNGERLPIEEAGIWAMGVKLEAKDQRPGGNKLEFIYEDRAAKLGNWITAATLLAMFIATVGIRLRSYRRKLG